MNRFEMLQKEADTLPGVEVKHDSQGRLLFTAAPQAVAELAVWLSERAFEFATLLVEETAPGFHLVHYFFYTREGGEWITIEARVGPGVGLPTISDRVHAADWHERETEDLFGVCFTGHPFLGDFVLHDEDWPENIWPMRHDFDPRVPCPNGGLGEDWRPRRLLDEQGALELPVGPIWGDYGESGLCLLETPGEQIRLAHMRLFYKYRGIEKIAEGEPPDKALLLAERFSGNAAFAHALAFCQVLESIADVEISERSRRLRVVCAELERMRYHMTVIADLAGSTGLAVGKAMGQELEEALLRLTGAIMGHRYLFGLAVPGGLARDLPDTAIVRLRTEIPSLMLRIQRFGRWLKVSSSFLDRIEEMGALSTDDAKLYGVVGPVGRAAGREVDLRRGLPYAAYDQFPPDIMVEQEGDGYARLRVFLREIEQSARLILAVLEHLPSGAVRTDCRAVAGSALGWVEAPAGAAFHWLKLDGNGCITRWRAGTPGFRNWHAFHRAVEGASFQDFPIILASFGLSVAENDR